MQHHRKQIGLFLLAAASVFCLTWFGFSPFSPTYIIDAQENSFELPQPNTISTPTMPASSYQVGEANEPAEIPERLLSIETVENSGLFEPYVTYATGSGAQATGIGDFNNNGLNDVAVTAGSQLHIFLQNEAGGLDESVTYATGSGPYSLAVGDLNNDGRDDVVVANFNDDTISVFLQQSDGTLAPQVTYTTADGPNAVAIADLNGNGHNDVVVSHWRDPVIGVFLQKADGTLENMGTYPSPQAGWDDIDVGDLNNDGRVDVVKRNGQGYVNPDLSVYLQNSSGTLDNPVSYTTGVNTLRGGIGVGDVTGDGLTDVVVAYGGNRPSSKIAVFAQTVAGTLELTATYDAHDIPLAVKIADLNLNGLNDVVVLHSGHLRATVYLQQPGGVLAPYESYALPDISHYQVKAVDVGDINNNGLPDVVVANGSHGLVVLYQETPRIEYLNYLPVIVNNYFSAIFDDFSDPNSGWPNMERPNNIYGYVDGEYRVYNKTSDYFGLASAAHALTDMDVSVSARRIGNIQGAYGLVFGLEATLSEYYAFIVWPDYAEWNLLYFNADSGFDTIRWGTSPAVHSGTASNHLQLVRQGDNLTLGVNGTVVFNGLQATPSDSHYIGLFTAPLTAPGHDVRFDDYLLTHP